MSELSFEAQRDLDLKDWPENISLLSRCWETIESDSAATDDENNEKNTFKIVQFNVLAHGLSCPESNYGGFDKIPKESLNWQARRHKLLKTIVDCEPDIICLEECDHFDDFFLPELKKIGFDGWIQLKGFAPARQFGVPWHDGCALLYQTEKFQVVGEEKRLRYKSMNQCAIAAVFQLKHEPSKQVTVAVTHLKAKLKEGNERIRAKQARQLELWLQDKTLFPQSTPVIVCADLNAQPYGAAHRVMLHSALELKSAYSHSKISVVEQRFKDASLQTKETLSIALPDHPLLFENRFETQELHPEPPFTTAKIRGKLSVKHTIDYIFYTPKRGLKLISLLTTPHENELPETMLPGYAFPSDHLHLAAKFQL